MNKTLEALYQNAISKDPDIATTRLLMTTHPGNDEKHLLTLGLEKRHLKKLARLGLAISAYSKNVWLPGEILPSGEEAQDGSTYRDKGHKRVWLIIKGD